MSVSAYFTAEDTDQTHAAVKAVGKFERYASITDLVEAATPREIRRLQRKHNGGKKWPDVSAGKLRSGQRTRRNLNTGPNTEWGSVGEA